MRRLWGVLAVSLLAACEPSFEPFASRDDHSLIFETKSLPAAEEVATTGVIRALSPRSDALLLGGDAGLFTQRGSDAPVQVEPHVLDPGEPTDTGAVHAFADRPNKHLLVAADHGVFVWNDADLVRSPMSDVAPHPTLVASGEKNGEERAAAVSDGKLFWFGGRSVEVKPTKVSGTITAIAFQNGDLFAAYGEEMVRLAETSSGFEENVVQLSEGVIHAMAVGADGALWVGAEDAILRRTVKGTDVHWDVWESNDPVLAVAPDPDGFGCWARTAKGAFIAPVTQAKGWSVPLTGGPSAIALDLNGNLWAADANRPRLERQGGLSAPAPSFKKAITPFIATYCIACHSNSASLPLATYDEWSRNAQRILLNLRVGTMPRDNPLPPETYRVVERWIDGGMLP